MSVEDTFEHDRRRRPAHDRARLDVAPGRATLAAVTSYGAHCVLEDAAARLHHSHPLGHSARTTDDARTVIRLAGQLLGEVDVSSGCGYWGPASAGSPTGPKTTCYHEASAKDAWVATLGWLIPYLSPARSHLLCCLPAVVKQTPGVGASAQAEHFDQGTGGGAALVDRNSQRTRHVEIVAQSGEYLVGCFFGAAGIRPRRRAE